MRQELRDRSCRIRRARNTTHLAYDMSGHPEPAPRSSYLSALNMSRVLVKPLVVADWPRERMWRWLEQEAVARVSGRERPWLARTPSVRGEVQTPTLMSSMSGASPGRSFARSMEQVITQSTSPSSSTMRWRAT